MAAELLTWCRLMRIGPACATPCDDCRTTSGKFARAGVHLDPDQFYDDPPRKDTMTDTTEAPPEQHHPFDPEAVKRVVAFLAAVPASVITIAIRPAGTLRRPDLQQVVERDAYAEKTRLELAEACAKLRSQRDDESARADRWADAFGYLAACVGQLDFDRTESAIPQTEQQWIEFVRGIDERAQKIIEQTEHL